MPLIDLTYPENALSNSGVHRSSQTTLSRSRFLPRRYASHICAYGVRIATADKVCIPARRGDF
jgi:hypothetical protein